MRIKLVEIFYSVFLSVFFSGFIFAGELDKQAQILCDITQINEGKSYPLLLPTSSAITWKDQTPSQTPDMVEIWFPYVTAPIVNKIEFDTIYDPILKADLEYWNGAEWTFLQNIELAKPARNMHIVVALKKALQAYGFRLIIRDVGNMDHSVLEITRWRFTGTPAQGGAIFKPDDLGLTCTAKYNVFDLPESARVKVSLKNTFGLKNDFRLVTEWRHMAGFPVTEKPVIREVRLAKGASADFTAELSVKEQGPYICTAKLYAADSGCLLAAQSILVGLRDRKMFDKGIVVPLQKQKGKIIPTMQRLKDNATLWCADATQSVNGTGRYPGAAFFDKIASAGGELLMNYTTHHNFEPLPGVYNLAQSDYIVEQARRSGLGLSMGLWWWDFNGPSQWWMADERRRDREGKMHQGWEGIFSPFSDTYRKHAMRAVEVMVKRYINSPEVWLWHPHPYGSVDHDAHSIFDFHPQALEKWHEYLKEKYLSIDKLNKAYGSSYVDWQKVVVPEALWADLAGKDEWDKLSRLPDVRAQWLDWLDFYHQGVLAMRKDMMKLVRKFDQVRAFCGTNASGGVGHTDKMWAALAEYGGFYGDQGLNNQNHVRRFVAKRRYGLPLRHEDIAPVTIGRRGFTEKTATDRCNWDVFQSCLLGVDHFNYVFTTWDNSPFYDQVFASAQAKKIIKEANRAKLISQPVALLHSFVTDTLEGKYTYSGISLHRWWTLNGFSAAMVDPGYFVEPFSDNGPLDGLESMKVIIDDGSRVLPAKTVARLVEYVKNGGKLVLTNTSGEYTLPEVGEKFLLLRQLGYTDTQKLTERNVGSTLLILNNNNPVFRRLISLPVNFWSVLDVPEGGRIIGMIGQSPGAVWWKCGKGEVVLLGGQLGAITEGEVQQLFSRRDKKDKAKEEVLWSMWRNAERERVAAVVPLMREINDWVGNKPLFTLAGEFKAVLRRNASESLLYIYNTGPKTVPVLRIDLPDGRYNVEVNTLTDKSSLGVFTQKQLAAPGVALPEMVSQRFMSVRISPVVK